MRRVRPVRDLAALVGAGDPASEVAVTGVTLDSRAVRPGDLYAALPGARAHGADFAGQAAAAGRGRRAHRPRRAPTDGRARRRPAGRASSTHPRAVLGAVAARVYGDPADAPAHGRRSPAPTARPRRPTSSTRRCARAGPTRPA